MSASPLREGATAADHPAISSVEEIIEDARNGRMFILVDDENRENEGDLVIPAQMTTPDAINFMAKHARGLICLALAKSRAEQLRLPLMSADNGTRHQTAFTVSIEAKEGVTTGISAGDRARTILVAIDPTKGADDIVTPGHVFPLVARNGGVLVRAGHTEAAVDISRLAGLTPAGVICEVMNDDGTMARLPDILAFAQHHGLKVGTIADLIAYRRQNDRIVRPVSVESFDSQYGGRWSAHVYANEIEGTEHLAIVKGEISDAEPTLVRMHTISLFDDSLGRLGETSNVLHASMMEIARKGSGVVVIIRNSRPRTLAAILQGHQAPDGVIRNYGEGAQILLDLGVRDMILLTNSRRHLLVGLEGYGLRVLEERPIPN